MTRLYGRAARGRRAFDSAPHGHWGVRTLISSIRSDGTTACMSVDCATDAEVFARDAQEVLAPSLRPDDIVVLDNLRAHKSPATMAAIRATGARVEFLPQYSPDLNPIEKMWSKIKAILRGMGQGRSPRSTARYARRSPLSPNWTPALGSPHTAIYFPKCSSLNRDAKSCLRCLVLTATLSLNRDAWS